jgi:hypothetical protein
MKLRLALLAVVGLSLNVSSARADDDWSHTTELKWSKTSGIRVIEPEGYTVSVGDASDTVPTVFNLPNEDKYYVVKVSAPDGASWSKKIEVQNGKQTVLRVTYKKKADAPKQAAKKTRSHIGKVANNNHKCDKNQRYAMKFEFLIDGEKIKELALKPGIYEPSFELPQGKYDVRYHRLESKRWVFLETGHEEVSKDGFSISYGCK